MPYAQILTLIVALMLIASAPAGSTPLFSTATLCLLMLVKAITWGILCRAYLKSCQSTVDIQNRLKRLEILSIIVLAADFYLLDLKTHLLGISLVKSVPSLVDITGLTLYCLYLSIAWYEAWKTYNRIGILVGTAKSFIVDQLRMILPAILPYVLISVAADITNILPFPWLQNFMNQPTGEAISFTLFILLVILMIPPMVKWLWACKPLPVGPEREFVESFLKRQKISFSEILLWPLAGGRACTAAVLGLVPMARYIMLTPCIMQNLTKDEIEAVLTHEIAHIKYKHLLYYFFFVAMYVVILYRVFDPIWTWFMSRSFAINLLMKIQNVPTAMNSLMTAIPLVILILLYFRYLIGFFMRNFERQADLYCFKVQGHPWHMITALKKVALLSGTPEEQPSWHHFGIGQRVSFLASCANNRNLIKRHEQKLLFSKGIFLACTLGLLLLPSILPMQQWRANAKVNLAELYLRQLASHGKQGPSWYIAFSQLLTENGRYKEAVKIYEKALKAYPQSPTIMNNMAWLLATTKLNKYPENRQKALLLAISAAKAKPLPYILDTLAECFYINGYYQRAIEIEKQAIEKNPSNRSYYLKQLEKFKKAFKKFSTTRTKKHLNKKVITGGEHGNH